MKRAGALLAVLLLAGCGSTKTVTQTVTSTVTKTVTEGGACKGSELTASFDLIPGSAGAGNIVYALKITNSSSTRCQLVLTGWQLLGPSGTENPTNIQLPATPTLSLAAGASVTYNARFTPDVPGPGETTPGQCEPSSATLRIDVATGTVNAPIAPPTAVCQHGSMTLTSG